MPIAVDGLLEGCFQSPIAAATGAEHGAVVDHGSEKLHRLGMGFHEEIKDRPADIVAHADVAIEHLIPMLIFVGEQIGLEIGQVAVLAHAV